MNTDNVVVELGSEKRYRGKEEYHLKPVARCEEFDLEVQGFGFVCKEMAKKLYEKNCDINRGYEVRREGTLVFDVVPLKSWVFPKDRRPEQLKKEEKT